MTPEATPTISARKLPGALEHLDRILGLLGDRPVCMLDFDGTLTPIVSHPDRVVLEPAVRVLLGRLAARCPVAVISGRDLDDVRRRVAVDALYYAGSHGYDISGPGGIRWEQPDARAFIPRLDRVARALDGVTRRIPGALLERKRFSLAVHYRNVEPGRVDTVLVEVERVMASEAGLRRREGKCVVEIQPDLPWSKGEAVSWLLKRLGDERPALYIGDDMTDEDAFRAVSAGGVGIIVGGGARRTLATFRLEDPGEVVDFLARVSHRPPAAGEERAR